MTVSSLNVKNSYSGDGTNTALLIPFLLTAAQN